MKNYKKAQIEARNAKLPLARVAGDLRRADQRLREKGILIVTLVLTFLSVTTAASFYFQPWRFLSVSAKVERPLDGSSSPAASINSAGLDPAPPQALSPVIDITRKVDIVDATGSIGEDNKPSDRVAAEPSKVAAQNSPEASASDNSPKSQMPYQDKSSETGPTPSARPQEAPDVAVATALSQLRLTPAPVEEANACVSEVRRLAKDATIYFQSSGVLVAPQYHAALKHLADAASRCPQVKFDVGGHTDNTGEVISNLQLSWQRAEAAINFLKSQGVSTSQFLPVGFSNSRPVSQDLTGLGQAKNRRVEFIVR